MHDQVRPAGIPTEDLTRAVGAVRWVWVLVDLTAFGAVVAYVLSRTTGLPTDTLDIGNWDCPLGIAAISTETLVVMMAMWQLQLPRPLASAAAPGARSVDARSDTGDHPFGQAKVPVSDRHRGR
jgi:hypothetical protein